MAVPRHAIYGKFVRIITTEVLEQMRSLQSVAMI
jgi:hypothetical protein